MEWGRKSGLSAGKRGTGKARIRCDGKRAVQLKTSDYDHYDYLIGMDSMNIRNIERMTGHRSGDKIRKLLEFAGSTADCRDPWYSGAFDETYRDVVTGCTAFLEYLEREGQDLMEDPAFDQWKACFSDRKENGWGGLRV